MTNYDFDAAREHFAARVSYSTGVHELEVMLQQGQKGFAVLDVRYPGDFAQGHVPGAVNLPKGKWQSPRGLRKDQVTYVYCYDQTCHLGAEAALALAQQGYPVVEVEGGFERWLQKGFRSEPVAQAA